MKQTSKYRSIWSVVIALMTAFAIVACDDGGGKKKATTNNYNGDRPCHGCSAGTDHLISGMGNSGYPSSVQIALDFFAPSLVDQGQAGTTQGTYDGPVEASGWLFVANGGTYGCTIPRGHYQMHMVSGGQGQVDQTGMITGVRMEGVSGGDRIFVRLSYAVFLQAMPQMVSCRGEHYSNELLGEIIIESVNDYPCTNSVMYFNTNQSNACI